MWLQNTEPRTFSSAVATPFLAYSVVYLFKASLFTLNLVKSKLLAFLQPAEQVGAAINWAIVAASLPRCTSGGADAETNVNLTRTYQSVLPLGSGSAELHMQQKAEQQTCARTVFHLASTNAGVSRARTHQSQVG